MAHSVYRVRYETLSWIKIVYQKACRRGERILSEHATQEGPICNDCDTPGLIWDLEIILK